MHTYIHTYIRRYIHTYNVTVVTWEIGLCLICMPGAYISGKA